jgi:hypothetical protein
MEYSLDQISHKFSRILGAKDQIAKELHETQNRLDLMERNLPIIEKAQAYLQTKAQETQNQLSFRVEDITQMAIDTCFAQEDYQFKLQFTPKRNKTDAEIF